MYIDLWAASCTYAHDTDVNRLSRSFIYIIVFRNTDSVVLYMFIGF